MKKNSFTAFSIPCGMVKPPDMGVKTITIQDSDFLDEFEELFYDLANSKEQRVIDTRMRVIYHHGASTDTICMGGYFTILVNGQLKEDSPEFLNLLKERVYNESPNTIAK